MDDLMTLAEAAKYLRCSRSNLYNDACKTGQHRYPFYKDGGRMLYSKSELDACIRSRRVASSQELQEEARKAK